MASIKDFFKAIAHFLGVAESTLEKIFHAAQPYLAEATKLALELSAILANPAYGGLLGPDILKTVQSWLGKYVSSESDVEAFVKANEGSLLPNLLHNAVAFAVAHTTDATLKAELLKIDTAVQLAYHQIVVENPDLGGGKTTVAALAAIKTA